MKITTMIFALLIIVMSCKKSKTEPQTTQNVQPVCQTKSKVFEGKYEAQSDSKDTIIIVFVHNNCPTEGVNTYSVYGLGKAYNNAIQSNLDVNKVYEIKSNEGAKSATTIGVNCKWGFGTWLSSDLSGEGLVYFKKL